MVIVEQEVQVVLHLHVMAQQNTQGVMGQIPTGFQEVELVEVVEVPAVQQEVLMVLLSLVEPGVMVEVGLEVMELPILVHVQIQVVKLVMYLEVVVLEVFGVLLITLVVVMGQKVN